MKTQEEISELAKEDGRRGIERTCFIQGYTQCQEDNKPFFTEETWNIMCSRISELQSELKDKKYTEEDMYNCWQTAFTDAMNITKKDYKPIWYSDFINSLNKQD